MLAFRLPTPVFYNWPTVSLSLLAAILASAVALYVVSRELMGVWQAVVGSLPMGGGIAAMHYIGMDAMRLAATCHYDNALMALSIVLAIVISFVALWLVFLSRAEKRGCLLYTSVVGLLTRNRLVNTVVLFHDFKSYGARRFVQPRPGGSFRCDRHSCILCGA